MMTFLHHYKVELSCGSGMNKEQMWSKEQLEIL
jgi:hypothetical protein